MNSLPTRRHAVVGLIALPALAHAWPACGASAPRMVVTKDPNCGCCAAWVGHIRAAGLATDVVESERVNAVKARLGVPPELASCHTAEVAGYVIEGHVPAKVVLRLLGERPQAKGLAVPGMPVGSPGMEVEGSPPDTYDVILFGAFGQRRFARFRGATELPD